MNKFIKLPLFLGGVCLFFGTALAAVYNVCNPIIQQNELEKKNAAYKNLYANVDVSSIKELEYDFSSADYKNIRGVVEVPHDNLSSYVYSLETDNPQSGNVSFMMGIQKDTGKIDSYAIISNNNSGYASKYENNETVLGELKSYDSTGTFPVYSGATKTKNAMKKAVDQALNHFKSLSLGGNNE